MTKLAYENAADFERTIRLLFEQEDWRAELAPTNMRGYDIVLTRDKELVAVQVKNLKAKVSLPAIQKFLHFLASEPGSQFSRGFFVSSSGYANTVDAYLATEGINNLELWTFDGRRIQRLGAATDTGSERTYIGVFTAKGGVGKTTVAAGLAGAFALSGYGVILVDLDVQGNLRTLLGDGVYVPAPRGSVGQTVTVLNHDEWLGDEDSYPDARVVVCDCSPHLEANPPALLQRFDYCVIPTTLNPLGINKNVHVIQETFRKIRQVNSTAELFVLINSFHPGSQHEKRNRELSQMIQNRFAELTQQDPRIHYIDPLGDDQTDGLAIRYSELLVYWGFDHLIHGKDARLPFDHVAGRCYPREDFLRLAAYLEERTEISRMKG